LAAPVPQGLPGLAAPALRQPAALPEPEPLQRVPSEPPPEPLQVAELLVLLQRAPLALLQGAGPALAVVLGPASPQKMPERPCKPASLA